MKKKRIIPIVLVVLIAAGVLIYRFWDRTANGDRLSLTGHIEATEVDLSFRLPGHVAALYVDEGDEVEKADLLAELKQNVYLARRDQARAKVDEALAYQASLRLASSALISVRCAL